MRTIKLTIAVSAMAALVAVMPMAASGAISDFEQKQNNKIKKANNKVNNALDQIEGLDDDLASQNTSQNNKNATQDERLTSVESTVATIVEGVPTIINGLTALQNGLTTVGNALTNTVSPALTQLGAGLTAVNAALQNPTTGLVGLNLARPQFAAFLAAGDLAASTGTSGGSGPNDPASASDAAGAYFVDFRNDVSKRFLTVSVFPGFGGAPPGNSLASSGQAIGCSVATVEPICNGVGVPDSNLEDWVMVTIQGQTALNDDDDPVDRDFAVAAISG